VVRDLHNKPSRVRIVAAIVGLVVLAALGGLWLVSRTYRPAVLKERMEALLSDQLESEVSVDWLEGSFFPRVALSGGGLVVRHKGRTDIPPLISIQRFEVRASLRALMKRPRHVAEVRLQGLQVHIAMGEDDKDDPSTQKAESPGTDAEEQLHELVVDHVEAPDTVLTLIPRKANKPPRVFTIHHFVMESVARGRVIPYIAVLTNPIPKGQIEASGTFGPWDIPHPALTPVAGRYVFSNADLNTINGLAGVLSSEGTFDGPLNRIRVQGTTDTPKFQVDAGGEAVPLRTTFTAVVDGSDGDTILDRVDASFLDTRLAAKGRIVRLEDGRGRRVEVEVLMEAGRVEDLLKLAVDSPKPMLLGPAQLEARLVIPPGQAKVLDKMSLRGTFGLSGATFTDPAVQKKIAGLSRHGQGKDNDEAMGEVVSNLRGQFIVENAHATFPRLSFRVPGAAVNLAGSYAIRSQDIDFHGHLSLDATLSEAAGGGMKSFFLKAIDPFFRKNGSGTELPIKITGNRKDPQFGLELFRKN
jgi:hypothetical protein